MDKCLEIVNLYVSVEDKQIIKGLNLSRESHRIRLHPRNHFGR